MAVKLTADESKEMLLATAKELLERGLVEGTSGNLSARLPDGNVVMTPSSHPYDVMTLGDLVVVTPDGEVVDSPNGLGPTTEKDLHLACLNKWDDINAVIHSHAKHCTMFAVTRRPIPCVIEEFDVYVGGDVPVAEYRLTGSKELGDEVSEWVGERAAVLMANHGLLTVGKDPHDAMKIASLVERTAEIIVGAERLGPIVPLPQETLDRFAPIYKMMRGM
jgi:L-fuculose-phosphate aldolase